MGKSGVLEHESNNVSKMRKDNRRKSQGAGVAAAPLDSGKTSI